MREKEREGDREEGGDRAIFIRGLSLLCICGGQAISFLSTPKLLN